MAYKFFDNWDLVAGRWMTTGHAVSSNGTVSADASIDGPVGMMPWFYSAAWDSINSSYIVYKHSLTVNGRFILGFSASSITISPVQASIEVSYESGKLYFGSNPSLITGFDNTVSFTGSTVEMRVAIYGHSSNADYTDGSKIRIEFYDPSNNVMLVDSGWLQQSWIFQSTTPETPWSAHQYSDIVLRPYYKLLSGTMSCDSIIGFTQVQQLEAETFLSSGDLTDVGLQCSIPAIDTSVVDINTTQVALTGDTNSMIFYTLNDGPNPEGPFSSKNNYVYSTPFKVTGTQHLRAISTAPGGIESPILDTWVGPTRVTVKPLEIVPPSCGFDSVHPVEVKMSHIDPTATIRYTLDGSDPTTSSSIYTGSITVHQTTTVKAVAYVTTGSSAISSNSYSAEFSVVTVPVNSLDCWIGNGSNVSVVAANPGTDSIVGSEGTIPDHVAYSTFNVSMYNGNPSLVPTQNTSSVTSSFSNATAIGSCVAFETYVYGFGTACSPVMRISVSNANSSSFDYFAMLDTGSEFDIYAYGNTKLGSFARTNSNFRLRVVMNTTGMHYAISDFDGNVLSTGTSNACAAYYTPIGTANNIYNILFQVDGRTDQNYTNMFYVPDMLVSDTANWLNFTDPYGITLLDLIGTPSIPGVPGIPATPAGIQINDPNGDSVQIVGLGTGSAIYFEVNGYFNFKVPNSTVFLTFRASDNMIGFTDPGSYADQMFDWHGTNKTRVWFYSYKIYEGWNYIYARIISDSSSISQTDISITGDSYEYYLNSLPGVQRFYGDSTTSSFVVSEFQYINGYNISQSSTVVDDAFFRATVPFQISATPTVSPASGDLSTSDITITGISNSFSTEVQNTSYNSTVITGATVPGQLSSTSFPIVTWSSQTEVGKLPSQKVRRTYYAKRDSTWFTDVPYTFENWDITRNYSNTTFDSNQMRAEPRVLIGRDSRERAYGPHWDTTFPFDPHFYDDGRYVRNWDSFQMLWNNSAFDGTQNLWFQSYVKVLSMYDMRLTIGFDIPNSIVQPAFILNHSTGSLTHRSGFNNSHPIKVGLVNTTNWTWTKQPKSILTSAYDMGSIALAFQCGRKGSNTNGSIRIRLVSPFDGNAYYDSDWISVSSPNPIRPKFLFNTRPFIGNGGQCTAELGPIDGHFGITDAQMENLFDTNTVDGIQSPSVSSVTAGSNTGSIRLTISPNNVPTLVNYDRHATVNSNLFRAASQQSITGTSANIPNPADITLSTSVPLHNSFANSDYRPFVGKSKDTAYSVSRPTSDFLTVAAVRKGEVEIYGNTSSMFSQPYFVIFDDGSRMAYTFSGAAIIKTFSPGSHWVKLVGYNNGKPTGETAPLTFTVPADGNLIVTAPTVVNANTLTVFQALASNGVGLWTYHWEFNDGFVQQGATITRTIIKPGRYSFKLSAVDNAENKFVESGEFVVPYTGTVAAKMARKSETRVS